MPPWAYEKGPIERGIDRVKKIAGIGTMAPQPAMKPPVKGAPMKGKKTNTQKAAGGYKKGGMVKKKGC